MVTYPANWKFDIIANIADITTGCRDTQDNKVNGRFPFFVRSPIVERIDVADFDCEAVLTAGDGVGTGKVFHYINGKFAAHQRVYVMSNFKDVDGRYFYYYFSNNFGKEVEKYTAKSSVDSVRRDMIAEMEFPDPPLPEQKEIVKALLDFDEHIDNLTELIEKKKAVRDGALEDLINGKTRLDGFRGDWNSCKINDVADFFDNLRIPVTKNQRMPGNTPYYGANGIQDYVSGYTHDGEFILIAEDGANDLLNYPVTYASGKIWVNNHAHVLAGIKSVADTKFLSYLLKKVDYTAVLVGGTRAKLNGKTLKNIEITLPESISEQQAIASILTVMDEEIESLLTEKAKMVQISEGAMDDLLTGRVHLKV
jgi:type I restriction enzyme S subunit